MQALEFNSVIGNEGVIHIPKQYLVNISSSVRVILLMDEKSKEKKSKSFSALKLKTKGFKFDRELANE
jgi:flagellar basal body rod protein FlgF